MNDVVTLLGLLALLVITVIWYAFVLKTLWRWFIVPTFKLPELTLPVAIGAVLIVQFLTFQYVPRGAEESTKEILYEFLLPLIALGMGFAVQLYVRAKE